MSSGWQNCGCRHCWSRHRCSAFVGRLGGLKARADDRTLPRGHRTARRLICLTAPPVVLGPVGRGGSRGAMALGEREMRRWVHWLHWLHCGTQHLQHLQPALRRNDGGVCEAAQVVGELQSERAPQ